ncbi:MAG: AAA family ATPase [Thermoplasmata archaeon]|nr:AAA family ATPase [Thermoplasmata archaeon]
MVVVSPGRVIAVDGASAAGKTRAVVAVARSTGWSALREGYRRLSHAPSLGFTSSRELLALEQRLLREEARRFSEARAQARDGITVIADSGFLGPLTYTEGLVALGAAPRSVLASLLALARRLEHRGTWGLADAYVFVDTPASVRDARTRADPRGHPPEFARRHREVGNLERRFYRERFAPLLGSRFRSVSGVGAPAVVARRVARAARDRGTPSPERGLAEAVLALFPASDGPVDPSRGNR